MSMFDLKRVILDLTNSEVIFSDIHIQEEKPVMVKTPRGWMPVTQEGVYREEIEEFLVTLNKDWKRDLDSPQGAFDRPITLSEARLRCNIFKCGDRNQISGSIRRLPRAVPGLKDLGIPEVVVDMVSRGKGLILTTGGTGSGKTTTQAALLDLINGQRSGHIITIEQPIEYILEPKRSIISQREVGTNIHNSASGLEAALRQKPDVIMVGEIRDRATMETVMHAAESGHLVLATLHTNSAESTVNKVLSFFGANETNQVQQMLSSVLIGVISQSLVPAIDGKNWLLAYEVMLNNAAISKSIRDGKVTGALSSLIGQGSAGEKDKGVLLNRVLLDMLAQKKIDQRDAIYATYDVEGLRATLKGQMLGGKA